MPTIGPERLEQPGVALERRADRPPPPQEHPRVPGRALDPAEELLGTRRLGLLLEGRQRVHDEAVDLFSLGELRDEIAVFGRRPFDLGPERDQRVHDPDRTGREVACRLPEDVAVDALPCRVDMRVGGQDEHDLVLRPVDGKDRQGDGGRGVATHRLEHERRLGNLRSDEPFIAPIGHHRDVRGQVADAVIRCGQERPFVEQGQEGLGQLGAAAGDGGASHRRRPG